MRVLIYGINYYPEPTGIGKYTGEMAAWLASRGHAVRVVAPPPYYPTWRVWEGYRQRGYARECIEGVDVWRCPLWVPSIPRGWRRVVHLASFVLAASPVLLAQIRWRPDVIVVVEPTVLCALQALPLGRLCGAKVWLHVQDFEVDTALGLGLLRLGPLGRVVTALDVWTKRRFDRVSAISKRMLERLAEKGVRQERRVYFPNWVDVQDIRPVPRRSIYREELGIDDGAVVVLYSGNMGEKQGLEMLVEAARRLEYRSDIQFVLCGAGSARRRLEGMAAGLENVHWLDLQPSERLNELLNLADIHVLPQRADAADLVMPSKLIGMLASGRPVVVTAAPGTELARAVQGAGKVVPPGDVSALARGIEQLVDDARIRRRFGMEARRRAEQWWSKNRVLEEFERELICVAEKRKRLHA